MKNGSEKLPFGFGSIFLLTTLRPLAVTSRVTCSPGTNPGTWPLAMILSVTPGRFGPSSLSVGGPVAALAEAAGSASSAAAAVMTIPALRDTARHCAASGGRVEGHATSFLRSTLTGIVKSRALTTSSQAEFPTIDQNSGPVASPRVISTRWYSGLNQATTSTQPGSSLNGKKIPEKRNIGVIPSVKK